MEENSETEGDDAGTAAYLEQRRLCLDHARDLIASTERVLANDNAYPNIAYHLAILAMEEIGKAGMLCARGVTKGAWDASWINKRLDNHVSKLMWAIWSPSLSGGKIDPADFEEARRFAQSTHERRIAGLYVEYEDSATAPPRQAVRIEHATTVLNFAKARLELEEARGAPVPDDSAEELEWYLATVSDELGQKRLFSQRFIQKHREFGGDTRAWVRWAREEFTKVAEAEKEQLRRELSRQASKPGKGKPKWLMKVRVQTPSHSLRQKTLNFWNDRIDAVKLRTAGSKNQDLLLELTIHDHVKLEQLFDFGLAFSKMHIVMLNIGTAGFFWYELSSQAEARTHYNADVVRVLFEGFRHSVAHRGIATGIWVDRHPTGAPARRITWRLSEDADKPSCRLVEDVGELTKDPPWPCPYTHRMHIHLAGLSADLCAGAEQYAEDLARDAALLTNFERAMHALYPR